MTTHITAQHLTNRHLGQTATLYCKQTRRSITTEILAIEHWPDEVIIWIPTDHNQDPYHLHPAQTIILTGNHQ